MSSFVHDPLARLIAPVDLPTMMRDHWDRRVLYVPGPADKFEALLDLESLRMLIEDADDRVRGQDELHFRAIYDHLEWVRQRRDGPPQADILPSQIPFMLGLGAHIGVEKLERAGTHGRALREVTAALKEQLSWAGPVLATCWISRRGAHLSSHFDPAASIVLQLSGTWRWRWKPEVELSWPPGTAKAVEGERVAYLNGNAEPWEHAVRTPRADELVEATLTAGDLLYVPAGAYHETETVGDETSVALHFVFGPARVMPLLSRVLEPLLLADPRWRSLPAQLGNDGSLPAPLLAFFGERLAELAATAASLDPATLNRAWQDAIAEHGGEPSPSRLSVPQPAIALERDDRLRFVRSAPVTGVVSERDGGASMILRAGKAEVTLDDPQLVSFARGMLEHREGFVAAEAVRFGTGGQPWPWEPVREVLQHLVDGGLLVIERDAA